MAQPPSLTPEQRAAALEKAAAARKARAELKERLKLGSVSLAEVLAQAESDERWHDLTVSTDRDDATAADRDPLGAAS